MFVEIEKHKLKRTHHKPLIKGILYPIWPMVQIFRFLVWQVYLAAIILILLSVLYSIYSDLNLQTTFFKHITSSPIQRHHRPGTIEMTVMMSDYPHKVLKLVCQAMVEIFANFVAQVLNKNRGFSFHGKIQILFNTYATKFAKISTIV